jgi:hypothetical protein
VPSIPPVGYEEPPSGSDEELAERLLKTFDARFRVARRKMKASDAGKAAWLAVAKAAREELLKPDNSDFQP